MPEPMPNDEPSSGVACVLARVWGDLCAGRLRITNSYSDEDRHYLELAFGGTAGPTARELRMLMPVLLGHAQKVVALDVVRSTSSVTTTSARGLRGMGLSCRPREVPMLVVMMARASTDTRPSWVPIALEVEPMGRSNLVLSVTRPDGWLEGVLSPCVRRIVSLRVDGFSHGQIANACGVSQRTVANQIGSAYRALGVSGRLELLGRLLVDPVSPAAEGLGARRRG